jgi:glycosyltransferase involved in cell wall biosynthesis
MNIAYIVSLKQPGLIAWIFREMVELEKAGAKISVFPTKYYVGPYMPREDWFTARWNFFDLFISQIRWLFSHPVIYIKVLIIALRFFSIAEFSLAAYFAWNMKKQNVERIHCHLGDRKLYTGYFCKLLLRDILLSVTIHAHELYLNPNWELFPIALNACDKIVCIADLNKKVLKQKWGISEEKLHVIRLFGFSGRQEGNPLSILCVGRFERKKGHDILLDAVSHLVEEGFDIEVWLAGSPEPGSKGVDVMGHAKNLGIEDRVVAFGEVGARVLKVLYRECDIFCLLSRHDERGVPEGIPVVLMEAMSMGKPVIATRIGATHELVEEILIEEENLQEALDSIRRLLTDSELRRFMGRRNFEIVKTAYSESNAMELFKILTGN